MLRGVSKAFALDAAATLAAEIARSPAVVQRGPQAAVRALDGISLDVADGEAMGILGPSGCGKSTLLRVVAGLEPVDEGHVFYDGEDVTDAPAKRRGVGMVFQNYALYPTMDSKRNLGFFFKMHRREPETEERVAVVCEIMGAGFRALLNRRPHELSGGQQQRVAIGRCVVREPRVFLFDEPLSNLDAKLRAHTRVEIKKLIRRFGITTIYVTHDQTEATAICDRIAVMRAGRVEQVGRFRDLYDRPINTFVAGFVGTPPMALLDGAVDPTGDRVVARAGHLADAPGAPADAAAPETHDGGPLLALPPQLAGRLPSGMPVTLGLRAEALRVVGDEGAGRPGEAPPAFDAWAVVSEPLVAEHQVLVTCALAAPARQGARGPEVLVRIDGTDRPPPGTPLRLAYDPESLHVFDAAGNRL